VQEGERDLRLDEGFDVAVVGGSPVLVGDRAPAEDRYWLERRLAVDLDGVDPRLLDHALVDPLVAEVETKSEPIARADPRQHLRRRVIEHFVLAEVHVGKADHVAVGALEVVEMGMIPAGEPDVDRARELLERVSRAHEEHAARSRIALRVEPREQFDPD